MSDRDRADGEPEPANPTHHEGLVPVEIAGDLADGTVTVFAREADLRILGVDGAGAHVLHATSSFYSGPTPHPEFLKQYAELNPGYADRVLQTVEKEQQHRIDLERAESERRDRHLNADIKYAARGQVLAFMLGLAAIGAATAIVMVGQNVASTIVASLIGTGGLGSLAYAFTRPPAHARTAGPRDKQSVPPPGN